MKGQNASTEHEQLLSWIRQAAGMTPRSAALRFWRRSFQTGGPRVFDNHTGAREPVAGVDFRAMQPLDLSGQTLGAAQRSNDGQDERQMGRGFGGSDRGVQSGRDRGPVREGEA